MKSKIKVLDMVYIAVCTALISVCAWIKIPGTVPFTLQTMGVFFALTFLGGKRGTITTLVYLLLGAIGLPVFSGFTGGIGVLLGTTGGYIVGFLFMGLVYMLFEFIFKKKFKFYLQIIALIVCLIVCYVFGTAWFMLVYTHTKGAVSLASALGWCVIPFIPFDLIKLALGFTLASTVKRILKL